MEQKIGLTEGNIFHGELTLDQLFFLRPVAGWAQFKTPLDQSLSLWLRCTPRRRRHGSTREARSSRDVESVMTDVVVIGASHNGLTAAAYLAKAGKDVVVVEKRDTVGGLAGTYELAPGFRASVVGPI